MNPNVEIALAYLLWLRPAGPWSLAAIPSHEKGLVKVKTFGPADAAAIRAWILEMSAARLNVYYHVNPLRRPDMEKKAQREDVAAAEFLWVDIDPRAGVGPADLGAEQDRIRERLTTFDPPPSAVVFSGNGYQALWRLVAPRELPDAAAVDEIERRNLQLANALEGDTSVRDVCRILRLPGTVNWPTESKMKKGREPRTAAVFRRGPEAYALDAFTPAPGGATPVPKMKPLVVDVDALPVGEYWKRVIAQGRDPDDPDRWESRSQAVFAVVKELHRAGAVEDTIVAVMLDPRNGISESILEKKSQKEQVRLITRVVRKLQAAKDDPRLATLSERFSIVSVGGKTRVVSFNVSPFGGVHPVLQSKGDFLAFHSHEKFTPPGGKKPVDLASYWWDSPYAPRYGSLGFYPPGSKEPADVLNTWQGWAVEPAEGDCSLLLAHVRDNICSGDSDHYNYLMDWCARMFQRPAEHGWSAIVMRGKEGVGKGVFAQAIGRLVGPHFQHESDPHHIVGQFNASQMSCLFLYADEAFFAGDRKHASSLKRIISEDSLKIELKGVDSFRSPSFLHVMMSSNEDWVVPAGPDARRFFMLDVGDARKEDHEYFRALRDQLEAGGHAALLKTFLERDVRGFNPRRVPNTLALQEQKARTVMSDSKAAWWYSRLQDAELLPGKGWDPVLKSELVESYYRYARSRAQSRRSTETELGMFLKKAVPWMHVRRLKGGAEVEVEGRLTSLTRPVLLEFAPVLECRAEFDAVFGGPYSWLPIDETQLGEKEPFS